MEPEKPQPLPQLPCACANLRRATRAVTRMYNQELRSSGLEITQFTLLMALDMTGAINQKGLARILAIDSTTLTRTLVPLKKSSWISEKVAGDRRQKVIDLTASGRKKFRDAQPQWQRAQDNLRTDLGEAAWRQMGQVLGTIAGAESKS